MPNFAAVVTTLVSILFPLSFVLYAWYKNDSMTCVAVMLATAYMGAMSLGEIIPAFGGAVAGGTFYFPTTITVLAIMYSRTNVEFSRRALGACLVALTIVCLGYLRWGVFAFLEPDNTTHDYAMSLLMARRVAYLIGMLGCAGLLILALQRYLEDGRFPHRFVVPLMVDMLVTAPFSLLAVALAHPHLPAEQWATVIAYSGAASMIIPGIFIAFLYVTGQYRVIGRA